MDLNSPIKVPIPGFLNHGGGAFPLGESNVMPENLKKKKDLSKPFSRVQIGTFFFKKLFIMKNLPDFRKMVETIVDPCLSLPV